MVKRIAPIVLFCALLTSCTVNQFIHKSIPVQEQITSQLENLSSIADEALALKIFTKEDRMLFARDVMIPAINANKTYAQCLLSGDCANLVQEVQKMVHAFQVGIDMFVSKMAVTPTTDKLRLALNGAITFANNLQYKGGK